MDNALNEQKAQQLGIDWGMLLSKFGPILAQILLNILAKRQQLQTAGAPGPHGPQTAEMGVSVDTATLRHLLAEIIQARETDMLTLLDGAEKDLLDTVVAKLNMP